MIGHPGLLLAAVTLMGAALRIAYAFKGGLWRDEAQALGIAGIPSIHELVAFLARHESHPPAYHLLLRGWTTLFGSSDASGLALSLLFGIALIPVVYLVTRELHSQRAAVLAAFLVSIHPVLFQYSASIRPYSLLSLLAVCLLFTLWRILRSFTARLSAAYIALALLMVYTHHWAWLVLASTGVLWMAIGTKARGPRELWRIAVVHSFIAIGYMPWMASLLNQLSAAGHMPAHASPLNVLSWSLFAMTSLPPLAVTVLLTMSIWVYLSRSPGGLERDSGLALGLAAGSPAITGVLTAVLVPVVNLTTLWCYSIVAPGLVIAIAILLGQREGGRAAFRALSVQAGWVIVLALTTIALLKTPRANTKEVAGYVRAHIRDGDRLIVVPGYLVPSFYRYFGGERSALSLPEDSLAPYIPYDHRLARDLDPRSWVRLMAVIDSTRRGCERLWVVVEAGVPAHMETLVNALLKEAGEKLGPPEILESSFPRLGVLEHSSVRRFVPCQTPNSDPPA